VSGPAPALPDGLLLAWYGDDFTGSAAVLEVLAFAGLPAVLFFDLPTPAALARFPGCRAIGIAGSARAENPAWMGRHLPPAFRALAATGAAITHYKICSTFDSAPEIGSIGRAIELAEPILGGAWHPLLTAAPALHRYQTFGNLFAAVGGTGYRLDRHPTMSRHPVTPMREADLRLHLAQQTNIPIGLVDFVAMKTGSADAVLAREVERGARIVALDVVDDETLAEAGRLIWENRGERLFAVGSQGFDYALVAHWRRAGLLATGEVPRTAGPARIAVASGSCSPVTAEQIDWASAHGFAAIRIDAAKAVDARAWAAETARAAEAALAAISRGDDPLVFTARGPDDPAVAALRTAVETSGAEVATVNARIGDGLGRLLNRVLREAKLTRAVIAGGDTSSHGVRALGVCALTALAPVAPGSALFNAHADDAARTRLELALKGGQMGGPDYFGRVRAGGGEDIR
jgi:3-oxoisoapionate kinase